MKKLKDFIYDDNLIKEIKKSKARNRNKKRIKAIEKILKQK